MMKIFSERLRTLRDKYRMQSRELAKGLKITESRLSYFLNGREPDFEMLIKIADYFNVSFDYLLGRVDDEKGSKEISNLCPFCGGNGELVIETHISTHDIMMYQKIGNSRIKATIIRK